MPDLPHYIATNDTGAIVLTTTNETAKAAILHGAVGNITKGLLWGTQITALDYGGDVLVRVYGNLGAGSALLYEVKYDLSSTYSASNVLQAPVPFGATYSDLMAWTLQTDTADPLITYTVIFFVQNLLIT